MDKAQKHNNCVSYISSKIGMTGNTNISINRSDKVIYVGIKRQSIVLQTCETLFSLKWMKLFYYNTNNTSIFHYFRYTNMYFTLTCEEFGFGIGRCPATNDMTNSIVVSCVSSAHVSLRTNGQPGLVIIMDCFVRAGEFLETDKLHGRI